MMDVLEGAFEGVADSAMKSWYSHENYGVLVRTSSFTDNTIETALVIKGCDLSSHLFESFFNLILTLMVSALISPTYSCISKRAKTVEVKYRNPIRGVIALHSH